MKYFIGFGFSLILFYAVGFLQAKYNIFAQSSSKGFVPSQSSNHNLLFLYNLNVKNKKIPKETQSRTHNSKTNIKVIVMDEQAYWIKDNVFYTADMSGDMVDKETTRVVDTMAMSTVQLDKMMFIIDRLREGTFDDSGGTRN